jgi:Uma2 family endonuclease
LLVSARREERKFVNMATTETNLATIASPFPTDWSLADLQRHLGGVPLKRIRLHPLPGTATEADVLAADDLENRLCELVDGVLVEKVMDSFESILACTLIGILQNFLREHPLGTVLGEAGMLRLSERLVRIPDVSFIRWDSFPDQKLPQDAIYRIAPDLAVEIISRGNPRQEMQLKLREYFEAGTRLVWYIDPRKRTAVVHQPGEAAVSIGLDGMLRGFDVLPGFELCLGELSRQAEGPGRRD